MYQRDRRLGPVIEYVWRRGGTFQEWSEHFNYELWIEAMAANDCDVDWYVHRHRTEDEVLPWDHLSRDSRDSFDLLYCTCLRGRLTVRSWPVSAVFSDP